MRERVYRREARRQSVAFIARPVLAFLGWVFVVIVFFILASCSPFDGLQLTPTATVQPTRPAPIASITPSSTAAESIDEQCTVTTGVPRGYLNLRTGAGVSFAVIRVLAEGETLEVIKRAAWLEVTDHQGTRGYVNGRYCR